ncbi:MAG: rhomboid family intramembrane serine protease [Gemmatimonadota bacterium]|nr:rhomboid family intramembrane serine protease [Gemmatimonadota bacterium]
MFPLRDENPTELIPWVTYLLIAANVGVWLLVQGMGQGSAFLESLCAFGSIPGEITGSLAEGERVPLGPDATCRVGGLGWETIFTSMFMHGGWFHLIGNMWFLWVFGNNIEDSMGHARYLVFYLLTGILASAAHVATAPASGVPTVGASGAISGIMGAYLVLYPRVRIQTLFIIVIFLRVFRIPAWAMLAYWFALQLYLGWGTAGAQGGGVAFWAHIGGFVAGLVLVKPFERKTLVEAKRAGVRLSRQEVRDIGWF